jgi:predicted nucleic acid-binding protein
VVGAAVILPDTSVWIDHLRGADTRAARELAALIARAPTTVALCEPIAMEVLAGPTDQFTVRRIENEFGTLHQLPLEPETDFRTAAALAREVRKSARTVSSLTDCLIAAVALRHGVEVWHRDADYVLLAQVSALRQRDLR